MPEYYATKRGYHLECDRPLHRVVGGFRIAIFSIAYLLNDP